MNVLNPFAPQVGEHFQHRLVDHVRVRPLEPGMLCGADPVGHDRRKLVGRVAHVRGRHDFEESLLAAGGDGFQVAFEQPLEGLLLLPLGMLRGKRLDPIERERELEVDRLLRPERAVVVEGRNPLGGCDVVRPACSRHTSDEVDDRLLRRAVVPCRQRVCFCYQRAGWSGRWRGGRARRYWWLRVFFWAGCVVIRCPRPRRAGAQCAGAI